MKSNKISYVFTLGATMASSYKTAFSSSRSQVIGLAKDVRTLQNSDVGRLGKSLENNRQRIREMRSELSTAQKALNTLNARAAASPGGGSSTLKRQISLAEKEVRSLSASLRRNSEEYRNNLAAARQNAGGVGRLRKEYADVTRQVDQLSRRQKLLSDNMARRDANLARRGQLRGQLFDAVALGAVVAAPAKMYVDFERSITRAGALARATDSELAALTASARELGRSTLYTASQAAEGMQYLAMAGFDVNETIAAMPGMLNLALAGGTDLGRTADIASNILSGFKIPAAEMDRVSDVLVSAFTSSNTTLETLGETMKYVAPVASALGVSLEEAASMAGFLGSVGIQGSMAGTSLRAALLRLASPPKQAAESLRELGLAGDEELADLMDEIDSGQLVLEHLGIATKDAAGNMRPFLDILEDINKATQNMGSGDRIEVITKIFGVRAAASMVELLDKAGSTVDKNGKKIVDSYGNQSTALRAYIAKQEEAAGSAKRFADKMSDTTHGSLVAMKSALEDTSIAAGKMFSPALRTTAEGVRTLANGMTTLIEKFPNASAAIGTVITAAVGLAVVSKAGAYAFTFVRSGLLMYQNALIRLGGLQRGSIASTRQQTLANQALARSYQGAAVSARQAGVAAVGAGRQISALGLLGRALPVMFTYEIANSAYGALMEKTGVTNSEGLVTDFNKVIEAQIRGEAPVAGLTTMLDMIESSEAKQAAASAPINPEHIRKAQAALDAVQVNIPVNIDKVSGLDPQELQTALSNGLSGQGAQIAETVRQIVEDIQRNKERVSYAG